MPQEKLPGNPADRPSDIRMSFLSHLDELRVRIMRTILVLALGFMICYFITNEWVLAFLRKPLFDVLPAGEQKLYYTSLFENFMTHLKIAAVSAVFLFSPYVFYELWAFLAPGLYEKERKMVVPFILGATGCFLGGAAFAYYILFPTAFEFFVTYGAPSDVPLLTISEYYTTALKLLLLFGAAFEMPVLIVLFGVLGLIDAQFLREYRRFAVIGITVLSALFAPPDAISMVIMMGPLLLLYELAILIVQAIGARKKREVNSGL